VDRHPASKASVSSAASKPVRRSMQSYFNAAGAKIARQLIIAFHNIR
ncbi:MAG: hypothetical protein JWL65_1, partial [Gammaproteobacteria bacterium]|nr:hypothetical protein [Gammaproteobacteria bacterium]